MAIKYAPTSHTAPETAKVDSATIVGLSPGQVLMAVSEGPSVVFLPTALTSDGFPGKMTGFTTTTVGTVS